MNTAPTPGTDMISSSCFMPSTDSTIMIASKSPSGLRGHRSARRSYSSVVKPQTHVASVGAAPRLPIGSKYREPLSCGYRMLCTAAKAWAFVSTPLKMTPINPISSACLTTHAA